MPLGGWAALLWVETGRYVTGWLLAHAYRLAAEAGLAGCAVVPDETWDRAVASLDWLAAGCG